MHFLETNRPVLCLIYLVAVTTGSLAVSRCENDGFIILTEKKKNLFTMLEVNDSLTNGTELVLFLPALAYLMRSSFLHQFALNSTY